MTEVDPDPYERDRSVLGGQDVPTAGDPTDGGRHGEIGRTRSVGADEPDDGGGYPVGGGDVSEEHDAPPVAEPGPGA